MTRIRRGHALPEIPPPHAGPAAGNARLRERDAAVQASGSRRRLGRGKSFPPCKPLKTKETELESRQIILPRSEESDAMAATVSPNRKESRRRVHPRRRSREIGRPGGCGEAKFSYLPNPLKKARNGEGISLTVALRAGSSRRPTPAVSFLRVGRGRYELDGLLDGSFRLLWRGVRPGCPGQARA